MMTKYDKQSPKTPPEPCDDPRQEPPKDDPKQTKPKDPKQQEPTDDCEPPPAWTPVDDCEPNDTPKQEPPKQRPPKDDTKQTRPKDSTQQEPTDDCEPPPVWTPVDDCEPNDTPKGTPKDPGVWTPVDDCEPNDTPRQKPRRPDSAQQPTGKKPHDDSATKVLLASIQVVLRDVAELAERVEQLEVTTGHLANRAYAPNNEHIRRSLARVRERAQTCLADAMATEQVRRSPPSSRPVRPRSVAPPSTTPTPSGAADVDARLGRARTLGDEVMGAAANARHRRDDAIRLREGGASDEEIVTAERTADEAETIAADLAEAARAELLR